MTIDLGGGRSGHDRQLVVTAVSYFIFLDEALQAFLSLAMAAKFVKQVCSQWGIHEDITWST